MAIKFKKRYSKKRIEKRYQFNQFIRANQLRVLTDEGENLGVLSRQEALRKAEELGKDLVVISEKADPPVAKILEYSKFLYEERKKQSASRAKAKVSETKEFVMRPSIGDSDLEKRIERSREFLQDGDKVKVTIKLMGREKAYPEFGLEKINRIITELADIARVEEETPVSKVGQIYATFVKR